MVSKLGSLPPPSGLALATTMPPELICSPLFPATLLPDQGVGGAQEQDAATLEARGVLSARAELIVPVDAVAFDDGVTGPARFPVVEHQDALAVPPDVVACHGDVPGVPYEDPELIVDGHVVAHHGVGERRVPDVEAGLVVADRDVVGKHGLVGFEPGDAIFAVVDGRDPG